MLFVVEHRPETTSSTATRDTVVSHDVLFIYVSDIIKYIVSTCFACYLFVCVHLQFSMINRSLPISSVMGV